jgi:hypothetical protein
MQGSWLTYSGDDPNTAANEAFFPWHYGSRDWSLYYVGEILEGSGTLIHTDQRNLRVSGGFSPREDWWLRAYYVRAWVDQGTSWGLADAAGEHFADEFDLAFDFALGETWSGWALGGVASPGTVAKSQLGDEPSGLLSLGLKYTF